MNPSNAGVSKSKSISNRCKPSDFPEVFCHMVVEEFLMRKNMTDTLTQFRREWTRPDEEMSLLSWYDVSLKLHLTEIMRASNSPTVLENIVSTLTEESSIRMRKSVEVAVEGLATLPRVKSSVESPVPENNYSFNSLKDQSLTIEKRNKSASDMLKRSKSRTRLEAEKIASMKAEEAAREGERERRRINRRIQELAQNSADKFGKQKPSSENWIPEVTRMRSLHRDLAVAKENLIDIEVRETEQSRELRRFRLSELERAHALENLGRKKKKRCGCCLQFFSFVNLPLSVSYKAIIDMRKSWSNGKPGKWSEADERLSVVPRCYDEVRVCCFCSQFFHELERYRPSFETMEIEEKRKASCEREKRDKEYWDPLKMCEKDREAMEILEKEAAQHLRETASHSSHSVSPVHP